MIADGKASLRGALRLLATASCILSAACSENGSVGNVEDENDRQIESTEVETSSDQDPPPALLDFQEIALEGSPHQLTSFRFIPGTAKFLALARTGRVWYYGLEGDTARLLGKFTAPGVYVNTDCGLVSIAFDPDFEKNHYIYLGQCFSPTHSGVIRLTFDPEHLKDVPFTSVVVIREGDPRTKFPWHNIGTIGFDTHDNLWALFGDKRISANSQDTSNNLGALVRIRPRHGDTAGGYDVVASNPFAKNAERNPADPGPITPDFGKGSPDANEPSPDIYAYGLRAPWTGVLDHLGRYWTADVGDLTYEEINLIDEAALNFGWPNQCGPDCLKEPCEGIREPYVFWDRESDHRFVLADPEAEPNTLRVAWVGLEYRPEESTDRYNGRLTNAVLYGDLCAGFVRAAKVASDGSVQFDLPVGHLAGTTGWDQGPDGFIYAVSFERCTTKPNIRYPKSKFFRAVLRD